MCSALARGKKTTFLVSVSSPLTPLFSFTRHLVCCHLLTSPPCCPYMLFGTPAFHTHEAYNAAGLALQDKCFPQTIAVCQTRASGLGLTVKVSDEASFEYGDDVCGVMVQYPATDGRVLDYSVSCIAMQQPQCIPSAAADAWQRWLFGRSTECCRQVAHAVQTTEDVLEHVVCTWSAGFWSRACLLTPTAMLQDVVEKAHAAKAKVVVATDLLALCSLKPPGEWGADIVIGSAQVQHFPRRSNGVHRWCCLYLPGRPGCTVGFYCFASLTFSPQQCSLHSTFY
jgi:Glycine cleavage system P-protein